MLLHMFVVSKPFNRLRIPRTHGDNGLLQLSFVILFYSTSNAREYSLHTPCPHFHFGQTACKS